MSDHTIPDDPFTQELLRIRNLIGQSQLREAALAHSRKQQLAAKEAA